MKMIDIPAKPGELLNKIKLVLRYFISDGIYFSKIKTHREAIKVLTPYRLAKLVHFRANFIYILPYVAKSLNSSQKRQILINHYTFLYTHFSQLQLQQLFAAGISYYQASFEEARYNICLQAVTTHLEFEGSMSLQFKINGATIYSMGLTIVPGEVFDMENEQLIFISSVQGVKNEFENIRRVTKYFEDNSLPTLLLSALQAIAKGINITKCIGVSAANQLSYKTHLSFDKFCTNYDAFWLNAGGVLSNGNYLIAFPVQQKSLAEIKQTHRNRTIKKRKKLAEIHETILDNQRFICK